MEGSKRWERGGKKEKGGKRRKKEGKE